MNQLTLKQLFTPYTKVSKILTFLICFYILISFFEFYLNALIGPYNKYLIILIILGLLVNNKTYHLKWYHISLGLWFLLKFISILWTRDLTMMEDTFTTQASMFMLFFLLSSTHYDKKFVKAIYNTFFFSSALMGFLGLFFSDSYLFFDNRQVLTFIEVQMDPNYLAANYLVAIALSLSNLFYFKKNRILSSIIFLINSYTIAITGSRGGIVTYILLIVLVIIIYNSSNLLSLSFLKKVFISLSIIAIILFLFLNYLPENIYDRLFNFESYGGGSDRVQLWQNAFNLYVRYPFFGGGWGAYYGFNGVYDVIHNTFLLILVEGGIVGFLLFFAPLIKMGTVAVKSKQLPILLILAAAFGPSVFLDALDQRYLWNGIILAFVLMNGEAIYQKTRKALKLESLKRIFDDRKYAHFEAPAFISNVELTKLFKCKEDTLIRPQLPLTLFELRGFFGSKTSTSQLRSKLTLFELQSNFGYGNYFHSKEESKLNLSVLTRLFESSEEDFSKRSDHPLYNQLSSLFIYDNNVFFFQNSLSLFELQSSFGYGNYFQSKGENNLSLAELKSLFDLSTEFIWEKRELLTLDELTGLMNIKRAISRK